MTPKTKAKKQLANSSLMKILDGGKRNELRALFSFDKNDSEKEVLFKFGLWARYFYPQYFSKKDAGFHKEIDLFNYRVYRGTLKYFVDIVFRGGGKTTRTKLFITYAITNDIDRHRKFIKILTKDINNAKQTVTDIYNMIIIHKYFYPEVFQKTELKKEERMDSFTTATGVKVKAGTVGMEQRGQIQEEARPDYIYFDDFETRKTLRSAVETHAIWDNMEEAKNGLSKDGGAVYTANYLSERGNVHKLIKETENKKVLIVPIKFNNQPMWSAYTMEEINNIEKDAEDFEGEYLCEPSAGHDIFFDRHSLDRQIKKQPIRVIADFKIFYEYDPSHRYGSGHDIAGGVGLDSSTSVFIDFSTNPSRVVATFKSNTIKPDTFGDEIKNEAERYGACIVAPETNNHGHATIGRLKQIYDNIYFREVKETRAGFPPKTREYGWHTNADTKPKMLFALKKAVEDGHLELTDEDLIAEMKSYTRDDLMDKDEDVRLTTRHFDLLIACCIAFNLRNFSEVKKEENNYQQPAYVSPLLNE